jgi:hypothetical protein
MNLRQAYALAHPLNGPADDISLYRQVGPHPTRDARIVSILSVDR